MRAVQAISLEFQQSLRVRLAACKSTFHRLIRVAGHFDSSVRMYINPVTGRFLPEEAAAEAQSLHMDIFAEWLALPLSDQSDQFTVYLRNLPPDDRDLLLHLLRSRNGRDALAPPDASPEARRLHSANLLVLLNLWK